MNFYTFIFFIIGIILFEMSFKTNILFFWISLNFFALSIIYFLNNPSLLGKKSDGSFNLICLIFFSPWFFFVNFVWKIVVFFSKEPIYSEILPNRFWAGRRFFYKELPKKVNQIIDLTSEFFKPFKFDKSINYICIPLLDGIEPDKHFFEKLRSFYDNNRNKNIYIHCAQGHGRTACAVAIYMRLINEESDIEKNLLHFQELRPSGKISNRQKLYLEKIGRFMSQKIANTNSGTTLIE